MFQFIYDEKDSKMRQLEVYFLYYNNKLYHSGNMLLPVKLEINRIEKHITLNNIIANSDKEICKELFDFIISIKDILDIKDYSVGTCVSSGMLYKEIYNKNII